MEFYFSGIWKISHIPIWFIFCKFCQKNFLNEIIHNTESLQKWLIINHDSDSSCKEDRGSHFTRGHLERTRTKLHQERFQLNIRNMFFTVKNNYSLQQLPHGHGRVPTAQGFQKCYWTECSLMSSRLSFPWKVEPEDVLRLLPPWDVLWLYDSISLDVILQCGRQYQNLHFQTENLRKGSDWVIIQQEASRAGTRISQLKNAQWYSFLVKVEMSL